MMVDFTVLIAIASATARPIPSSENGYSVYALGAGTRMARTIHHEIGAEAPDDIAHRLDARLRRRDLLNIYRCFRAELARQLEPRRLRRPDADHAGRTHFLCGGDCENSDRAGTLDHHRIAPCESAGTAGAIESADT